jgi:septum formation topological specificity factor MinE
MRKEEFTNEILQRMTAIETNMQIILAERPDMKDELLNVVTKNVEIQRDIEHNRKQIEKLEVNLNKIFWGMVSTSIAVIGTLLSHMFMN